MIPLVWFLIAWLALMGIFALACLVTIVTFLNYGLSNFTTYFTTAIFLGVAILVLALTGGYLLTVDWSRALDLFGAPSALPL